MTQEEQDLIRVLTDTLVTCCQHLELHKEKADLVDAWRSAFWKKQS